MAAAVVLLAVPNAVGAGVNDSSDPPGQPTVATVPATETTVPASLPTGEETPPNVVPVVDELPPPSPTPAVPGTDPTTTTAAPAPTAAPTTAATKPSTPSPEAPPSPDADLPSAEAPPTPDDDSFTAHGPDVVDVLANDSDPAALPLTVTATTAPAHGTVACGPLGGCFYVPTPGYIGADSFGYTVSNGSSTANATVSITVEAGSGGQVLAPVTAPDVATTSVDTPATVMVLANDSDPNGGTLSVKSSSNPGHGTVVCQTSGSCLYTPTPGFTGFDFFQYTAGTSAGSPTTVETVQLRIGSGPLYGVSATGSPSSVAAGSEASWVTSAFRTGLPQEFAELTAPPTISAQLQGAHAIVPGSVTTPPGWNAAVAGDGLSATLTASSSALLGDSVTQVFPKPLPPISQGTGGDGHVPILVGSRVLAIFHHTQPTSVSCVDRATGQLCPGYPHQVNVGSSDNIGPGAIVGSKFWTHVRVDFSYTQSAPFALFCWDAAANAACGLSIVDRTASTQDQAASAPVVVGNKVYFGGGTGKLYCIDGASGAPCATPSVPTGLTGDPFTGMDIITHGGKVFVSSQSPAQQVACIDTATDAPCAGWTGPVTFSGYDLVNRHDAGGGINGFCVANSSALGCADDGAPGTVTPFTGWPLSTDTYTFTQEAEIGSRSFGGLGPGFPGLGCWDWATQAACAGPNFTAGRVTQDSASGSLPDAYGAAWDGSCVVALGDSGRVYSVDSLGSSPCTSLGSGAAARVVDLRAQRCDGSVGGATWTNVTLTDADLTPGKQFTSLKVTVRDAATNAVLLSTEMVGTNGVLDLSSIDPVAHPSLSLDASASATAGSTAWDEGHAPKFTLNWHSDAVSGCFKTIPVAQCASTPPPVSVVASLSEAGVAPATASVAVTVAATCETTTTTTAVTTTTTTPTVSPPTTSPVASNAAAQGQTVSGSLPVTGFALGGAVVLAMGLLGGGIAAVAAARRRPQS